MVNSTEAQTPQVISHDSAEHLLAPSPLHARRESMCKAVLVGPGVQITAHEAKGATCLALEAQRLAGHACASLSDQFLQLVGRMPHPVIVIDFAAVEAVSIAVAGQLLACFRTIKSQGRQVKLAGLSPELARAFNYLDVNRVAGVFNNVSDALASVRTRRWWHIGVIS